MFRCIVLACLTITFFPIALASDAASIKKALDTPLTIDSRDGLECDREKQICTAQGQVVVRKGPYEMFTDKAIAFLGKDDAGGTEIRRIEAHNNIRLFGMAGEAATADDAYFDMNEKVIRLTPNQNKQVHVWKDNYLMLADELTIHLETGDNQKMQVRFIEAKGHVTLSAPDEVIKGDNVRFTPSNHLVIVTGDVRVNRAEGQLRGTYAEVNIDTKLSKVLKRPGDKSDNRVQVIIYPEKVRMSPLVPRPQKDSAQ